MSNDLLKWLNATVVLSAIVLVLNTALLVLRIAFTISSFGDWTLPSCAVSSYLQLKINQTPRILKINSVLNGLALTLAVITLVLLIQRRRSVATNEQQGREVQIPNLMQTTVQTYPLISFQALFSAVNAGSAISLLTYNNSCQIIDPNSSIAILITSNCALLVSLALLTVVIYLNRLQPSQDNDAKPISITDRQRQEQEIQKKLEEQAKEYLTNNHHNNKDLMKGLLQNEQEIFSEYSEEDIEKPSQKTVKETPAGKKRRPGKNRQGKDINIGDAGEEPIQKEAEKSNNTSEEAQKIKDKKQKRRIALMHGYHQNHHQDEDGQGYEYHKEDSEQLPNNREQSRQERQARLQEIRRLKNLLHVAEIDNISDKFEDHNFELQEDLPPIADKRNQQQLSHLQIKELNRFTDEFFNLKSTKKDCVSLEKQYIVLGDKNKVEHYNINIHFAKIMQHKANLKLIEHNEHSEEMSPNLQQSDPFNIGSLLETAKSPLNAQIAKLSKMILFKNYPRLRKDQESHKQYECPISKYIDRDEQLQIVQHKNSKHKGKRGQYDLEKVVFQKKKKYLNKEQTEQVVQNNYNDKLEIIKQRREVFGSEWLRQRQIQQKFTPETPQIKSKRFSNLSFIRSKCQ